MTDIRTKHEINDLVTRVISEIGQLKAIICILTSTSAEKGVVDGEVVDKVKSFTSGGVSNE